MAQQLQLQLILERDVISGFSYSFCRALVNRLKKLVDEDKAFEEGEQTDLFLNITNYLYEQIPNTQGMRSYYDADEREDAERDAKNLIASVEEFLAIFESKE